MNLENLHTDLSTLGSVTTLEEVAGELRISVAIEGLNQVDINAYNSIITNGVLTSYPNVKALAFEGETIKAIYKA